MAGPVRQHPGSWGCKSVPPKAFPSQFAKNIEFSDHYPSRFTSGDPHHLSAGITEYYKSDISAGAVRVLPVRKIRIASAGPGA
jgi:hypothetical protein